MNAAALVAPYLSDPRDQALFSATPGLMQPRFGTLPPLEVGQHRFVLAEDGLYVQARSLALTLCLRLARTPRLPYGPLTEVVEFAGGPLPEALRQRLRRLACEASPLEWAALVRWDAQQGSYELIEPTIESVSRGHIRYHSDSVHSDDLLLDIHSHGTMSAFFSSVDDASDQSGIYVACVLGRCADPGTLEVATRLVVHGIHYRVDWSPV